MEVYKNIQGLIPTDHYISEDPEGLSCSDPSLYTSHSLTGTSEFRTVPPSDWEM